MQMFIFVMLNMFPPKNVGNRVNFDSDWCSETFFDNAILDTHYVVFTHVGSVCFLRSGSRLGLVGFDASAPFSTSR